MASYYIPSQNGNAVFSTLTTNLTINNSLTKYVVIDDKGKFYYTTNGGGGGSTTPGGSTGQIQYNNANTFGGVSSLTYDGSNLKATGSFKGNLDGNATTATTAGALTSMNISQFTNNSGYLTGINSSQVTTALGFTPYNSTNPSGYTTNTGTVTSVGGTGTVSGLSLSGTVTTSGNLTLGGTLTLTSGNVTTALGFTPYNSTNPSGYITSSSLSSYLPLVGGSLTGQLIINTTGIANTPTVRINTSSSAPLVHTQENFAANLTASQRAMIFFGKEGSTKNSGGIGYFWAGNASNSNFITLGHWGNDDLFRVYGDGSVTVGTNTVLHAGNYNSYSPTLTGGGASGTWNISISGNLTGTQNTLGYSVSAGNIDYSGQGGPQILGNGGGASMMSFHRPGSYAINFGLGTDNQLRTGGWSRGGNYVILDSGNYTSYSPTLTGGGASGTWGINVTGNASTASSIAWGGVTGKPSNIMFYEGFTLNADTMSTNSTGFTYSVNAPYVGPIARFSTGGSYDLWLNATYSGNGSLIAYRTRNGDAGSFNSWHTFVTSANYNSYSPTLTGTGASGTWGISVTGNAGTAGGFTPSQSSGTANRIVVADGNGYIINNYFNASGGGSERNASGMGYFAGHNSSDYYYRSYTAAAAAALLSGQSMNINGTATNITAYSINQNLSTTSTPTFGDVYNNGWFRNYGATGMYNQSYGSHFRVSTNATFGTWEMFGYGKNGYSGLNIIDASGYWNNMMFEGGNGGLYQENGAGWIWYYNRTYGSFTIGSGTVSATYKLYVEGSVYATGTVTWASDERKKENILTINTALDKVIKLRGVYFNRIDDKDKKRQIGVIAQEVEEVLPEVVTYDKDNDSYSVSYGNIVGVLIEAMKEQQIQIEQLKQEIEILKNK